MTDSIDIDGHLTLIRSHTNSIMEIVVGDLKISRNREIQAMLWAILDRVNSIEVEMAGTATC